MKWFGVDSDTPGDPKIRRVLREFGNTGMGALFRVWCFVANHGAEPGRAVDGDGRPFTIADFAEAAGSTPEKMERLLVLCAETGHIDATLWTRNKTVFFPAMASRADEYSKKLARKGRPKQGDLLTDADENPDIGRTLAGENPRTRQDTTKQHKTGDQENGNRPSPAALESWFTDEFWAAYPNRVAKQDAFKALQKLKPTTAELTRIMAGLARWKASKAWVKDNGDFVPHPATWINGRRFDDFPPAYTDLPSTPPPVGRTGAAATGKYAGVTKRDAEVH